MNARQIAYLASRLFAAYLLLQVVPDLANVLAHYLIAADVNGDPPVIYFLHILVFPIIGCMAIFVFWSRADWMSGLLTKGLPKAETNAPHVVAWERLGLMVVGGFALADLITEIARILSEVMIYGWFSPDNLQHNAYLTTYLLHGLGSLCLTYLFLARPDSFLALVRALRRSRATDPSPDTDAH